MRKAKIRKQREQYGGSNTPNNVRNHKYQNKHSSPIHQAHYERECLSRNSYVLYLLVCQYSSSPWPISWPSECLRYFNIWDWFHSQLQTCLQFQTSCPVQSVKNTDIWSNFTLNSIRYYFALVGKSYNVGVRTSAALLHSSVGQVLSQVLSISCRGVKSSWKPTADRLVLFNKMKSCV